METNLNIDKGHQDLIQDLKDLLAEAEENAYHDFKSMHYDAPKTALAERLHALRQKCIDGDYDNNPIDITIHDSENTQS